ncbi:MAG: glycosyltransferase [Elainella sp. C42_A2020_010]|nr:glycosyltransferase [Elainella sp. C42_A2020_010]RNJ65921.1 MAG: glycosyltransferase [Leptolyngbya sp. IPPAS B-1204]
MNLPVLAEAEAQQIQGNQLRVLLSAYACEPHRGSEPGVGWNTAREIARYHQVWVLTSNTHRVAIEAELAVRPVPNLHIVYLDPLGWAYDWSQEGKRSQWNVHFHYYLWQIQAYFVARQLHEGIKFDLMHHVTYVKYSSPSFLALLPIPLIWGPVGGAEMAPKPFWQDFNWHDKIYEHLRSLARQIGELDPFVNLTARRSIIALVTTEDTAKAVRRMGARNVAVMVESGLTQEEIQFLAQFPSPTNSPIRFISMGRLLHWKGFHLGLRAFAQANLLEAEYWILGEGPVQEDLQSLVKHLGISHQVKFLGRLPRNEGLCKLRESDVLVHPSLHDSGGWVCLEAMAAGRPVICLDLGGPAIQVTSETGVKIAAHHPEQVIQDLSVAMIQLANDPDLREQMGKAGQKRILAGFSWQSKAERWAKFYQEILV